jgi:hypothetical protein
MQEELISNIYKIRGKGIYKTENDQEVWNAHIR